MTKRTKILITGGNGYIATQFINSLASDFDITCLLRGGSTYRGETEVKGFIYSDGTLSSLRQAVRKGGFDVIYHLAATYSLDNSLQTMGALLADNVLLSSYLMAISADLEIPMVMASTFSIYDEDHNLKPSSLYDITKQTVSQLAHTYKGKFAIVNFPDTYGPSDPRPKVHNLINEGKIKSVNVGSESKLNLISTKDIIRAFLAITDYLEEAPLGVYPFDLFYPENTVTFRELATHLGKDLSFLGVSDTKPIPKLKYPIPGFRVSEDIRDIGKVLNEVEEVN